MTQGSPLDTGGPSSPSSEPSGSGLSNGSGIQDETIIFGCRCSNVRITGNLCHSGSNGQSASTTPDNEALEKVWLDVLSERAKHSIYVGYDVPEYKRPSRRSSTAADDEEGIKGGKEMVWRVCWLCDTKLYWVGGKRKDDPAVEDGEVTIHRYSGIIIKSSKSENEEESTNLPYSDVSLPIPSSSSFGRPPREPLAPVYPPIASPIRSTTYLPRMPDPFFLPPPFIPNHPQLRLLCANAVDYLEACHRSSEDDVRNYIDSKAREMRELEEKVRGEVEVMWEKYCLGPGREEVQERERRRSESLGPVDRKRERSKSSSSQSKPISSAPGDQEQPSESPIPKDNLQSSIHGASLLSASISQRSYMPSRPSIPAAASEDVMQETAKNFDKKGDLRAMAMSYVLSNMPGFVAPKDQDRAVEDLHGKDSWIDEERNLAKRMEGMGRKGSRPETVKEQEEGIGAGQVEGSKKGKERVKGKVSFEEPVKDGEDDATGDDDDYVFDFELEDRAAAPEPSQVAEPGTSNPEVTRSRNIVEDTLSSTYASHAPSHRSAHQRSKGRFDLYAPVRRRNTDDELDSSASAADESSISKLATSVPVAIALPGLSRPTPTSIHPFERKTSLSDRQAMRQRGILAEGNSLGLTSPTPTAPASPLGGGKKGKEREPSSSQSQQGSRADPGAVSGSSVDKEENGEEVDTGTFKDKKFVPPHVLARKESMQSKDVGWRSMATD